MAQIYHRDDSLVIFKGNGTKRCDVVVFLRQDLTSHLDAEDVCKSAPHFLSKDAHAPPCAPTFEP